MKKIIFLLVIFMTGLGSIAQQVDVIDSMSQTPQQQFEYITQNLDLTEVSSGLLADKALRFLPINDFKGDTLTDRNKGSYKTFGFLHASISGMPISSNYELGHPSVYTNIVKNSTSSTTNFVGLHYEYHFIDSNALVNNLITSNGQQLFDVPNRPNSPYIQENVFLITPVRDVITTSTTNFIFKDSMFFSNTGKTIQELEVDFDDGRGFLKINFNNSLPVTYSGNGDKIIKTKITYTDQSTYVSHAKFKVNIVIIPKVYSLDFTKNIIATTQHDGETGSAELKILLGCGHSNIQKPLIWVEGFNPVILASNGIDNLVDEDLDYGYMTGILNYRKNVSSKRIRKHLEDESYDLIYVDFTDGADSLQKNAYAVQEAIRWVNEQKVKNGSSAKNIVIGESMGGVIARYALRKMEMNNEDHETSMYFSLDAPHQGANIPLGAQYANKHVPHINLFNTELHEHFGEELLIGEKIMNTPAAKQLLLYQATDDFNNQTGSSIVNQAHSHFYSEYSSMGPLQNCKSYLSTNGSNKGATGGQGFDPEDELIKIAFNNFYGYHVINNFFQPSGIGVIGLPLVWLQLSVLIQGSVNFRINALPDYSTNNKRIYKGHFSGHVLLIPITWTHKIVKVKEVYPYDSSPGGFFDIPIAFDFDDYPAILETMYNDGKIEINTSFFNYIPVFSGLDLPSSYKTDPYASIQNLNTTNSQSTGTRTVSNDAVYVWPDLFGVDQSLDNSLHIRFYKRKYDWFIYNLIGDNTMNELNSITSLTTQAYNFGSANVPSTFNFEDSGIRRTTSKIEDLNTVSNNGKIYINKHAGIAFANDNNAIANTYGSHFNVWLSTRCGESSNTLTVENGGEIVVGQYQHQTGTLHISENSTLVIGVGGKLTISENSNVIVQAGGKLIIEDGGIVVNHGNIRFMQSTDDHGVGLLEFHDGAKIFMSRDESEIHFDGGELLVKQNAKFQFISNSTSESGQLRFSKWGARISGESNSSFSLKGNSKSDPILIVDKNADFWAETPDLLKSVSLSKGKIVLDSNARVVVPQRFTTNNANFEILDDPSRGIVTFDRTFLWQSDFNDVQVKVVASRPNGYLYMTGGLVNYTLGYNAFEVVNKRYAITNSAFNITGNSIAIYSENLDYPSYVSTSTFTGQANSVHVLDESSSLVTLRSNSFISGAGGAGKNGNGQMAFRCNDFDGQQTAIYIGHLSIANLSNFSNFIGYNEFSNISNSSIYFDFPGSPLLDEGYNDFYSASTSSPYFGGDINLPNAATSINATKNIWNSSFVNPSQSRFAIFDMVTPIVVVTNPTQGGTCGQYDDNTNPSPYTGVNSVSHQISISIGGSPVTGAADQLLGNAMMLSTVYDSTSGNNNVSMDYFREIALHDYSQYNVSDEIALEFTSYTIDQMKYTLQSAFSAGEITEEDNSASFHPNVAKYVDALNRKSQYITGSTLERLRISNELDKVDLFDLIGHEETALSILANVESCGLDSLDQLLVNRIKLDLSNQIGHKQNGYESYLSDTIYADTSSFIIPSGNSENPYLFGSTINSISSISFFTGCEPESQSSPTTDPEVIQPEIQVDDLLPFSIFPNPTEQFVTIQYQVGSNDRVQLSIYNIEGKMVVSKTLSSSLSQDRVNLQELSQGSYYYKYVVNGTSVKTGTIIKL